MMDNATHHHQQIVQLNNANPQMITNIQQQTNNKSPGEMDNFLTIRLLMQGKVRFHFFYYFILLNISRKLVASLANVVIILKQFEKK